jgi:WD40 repeat protein
LREGIDQPGQRLLISLYFSGSTDGKINCWNTDTGVRVAVFNCDHPGPVQCVQFNPKLMMLATACTNMVGHCNKLIKSPATLTPVSVFQQFIFPSVEPEKYSCFMSSECLNLPR